MGMRFAQIDKGRWNPIHTS